MHQMSLWILLWLQCKKSHPNMSYFTVIFTRGFPILIILIIFKINVIIGLSPSQKTTWKMIIRSVAKIIFLLNFETGELVLKTVTELRNLNPLVINSLINSKPNKWLSILECQKGRSLSFYLRSPNTNSCPPINVSFTSTEARSRATVTLLQW